MTIIQSEKYNEIFYPKESFVIDAPFNLEKYREISEESKYSFKLKAMLLSDIIKRNPIEIESNVKKYKKCLPNGLNEFHSFSDKEYESLQREFNKPI
jgi:hypothetical protein